MFKVIKHTFVPESKKTTSSVVRKIADHEKAINLSFKLNGKEDFKEDGPIVSYSVQAI